MHLVPDYRVVAGAGRREKRKAAAANLAAQPKPTTKPEIRPGQSYVVPFTKSFEPAKGARPTKKGLLPSEVQQRLRNQQRQEAESLAHGIQPAPSAEAAKGNRPTKKGPPPTEIQQRPRESPAHGIQPAHGPHAAANAAHAGPRLGPRVAGSRDPLSKGPSQHGQRGDDAQRPGPSHGHAREQSQPHGQRGDRHDPKAQRGGDPRSARPTHRNEDGVVEMDEL